MIVVSGKSQKQSVRDQLLKTFIELQKLITGSLIRLNTSLRWNKIKDRRIRQRTFTEAKRIEFPDKVIGELTGKTERENHELRNDNGIIVLIRWLILVRLSLQQKHHITTLYWK